MQDFTGVPAVVDLAAMREAVKRLGGDTAKVNPLSPVDPVIDHSVTVDRFGDDEAFEDNVRPRKWSGTTNATLFCAGGSRPSAASAWCRRAPVFATSEPRNTLAGRSGARR